MPYIGRSTDGFGVRNRFIYLASSGDTSVSGADANGATLTFTDGAYVDVYLNGVLLKPTTDYNTSTAGTIAGLSALNTNDEVTVVVYDVFTVADMVSATSGGTFSGDVSLTDNVKLNIGAGPANNRTGGDLQIYHDGSKTVIDEDGTGALEIKSNRLYIRQANDELLADFRKDQYVRLYYDNTKRFETTDNGVEITGDIVFSGSGNGINLGVTSNTDSNTLDDYEEGTFTPAFQGQSGSAGSFATSISTGKYTKIGNTVRIAIYIIVTNYGSYSGNAQVTGLPFTGVGDGSLGITVSYFPADTRQAPVSAYIGGTTMVFPKAHNSQSGGLSEKWQVSDLLTSKYIMAEGVYSV